MRYRCHSMGISTMSLKLLPKTVFHQNPINRFAKSIHMQSNQRIPTLNFHFTKKVFHHKFLHLQLDSSGATHRYSGAKRNTVVVVVVVVTNDQHQ